MRAARILHRHKRHLPMSVFTLTAGPDTFVGGAEDDTVNGTAATLMPAIV